MKSIPVVLSFLTDRPRRRNLLVLTRLMGIFVLLVAMFAVAFHFLMAREGREFSWATGVYWVLTVMSTLGFGDITFESDAGRIFSVVVLLSGTVFMLVLLPFMFIQFFYLPWMEAQAAARAPRTLSTKTTGHVILTGLSAVEAALIRLLERSQYAYVVLVAELDEALRLHDAGYRVMLGDLDDPETYIRARAEHAALVVTARADTTNTNVAFTVREISEAVTIAATAASAASIDILELAGCNKVLQFGEMLGQALARRILGRDAKTHVIGEFGDLLIAEAAARHTPLVGRDLRDIRLRDHANVNVVGVWDRGRFRLAGPDTRIESTSVLVLAGSREQLDAYDELFCIYEASDKPVVIIGGGHVGQAVAAALDKEGVDYRIVDRRPVRAVDPQKVVQGDAAEIEVLQKAGIMETASVVITTHDDDMNVYLTIYCRRLRPDIQILGRAHLERNVSTLHRAGADFVMSYASTGANTLFNLLGSTDILLVAEGVDVFRIPMPEALAGRALAESRIREAT
ncbi:MAG: potassium channel protein, partial [Pirellulaceae bacterium]|nr:potassium channel protein [Pirellulaceae bacterium]